jgi:hypothetical protein
MKLADLTSRTRSRVTRHAAGVLAVAATVAGLALFCYKASSAQSDQPATPALLGDAKRGEYLVTILDCNGCHTPWKVDEKGMPGPDMTRMLSGHPEALTMPPPPELGGGYGCGWGRRPTRHLRARGE